ncbi:MAG TPA: nitroreductase/quinone reductase family protein [Actinocatenispora sp.]
MTSAFGGTAGAWGKGANMLTDLAHGDLAKAEYVFLTTNGLPAGRYPRTQTVELWFAVQDNTVYLLSATGDRPQWVRNLARDPAVEMRIDRYTRAGRGRILDGPEAHRARRLMAAKYAPHAAPGWGMSCLAVAVDLAPADVA